MKALINSVHDLLFPRCCPLCHEIIGKRNTLVCKECSEKTNQLKTPLCMKCGKEISSWETEYCYDCDQKNQYFERCVACFSYNEVIRESMYYFKYKGRREYANFYVASIVKRWGNTIASWNPQVFLPVPLHKKRMYQRGYNQAELLGRRLGKIFGIPVDTKSVYRKENTKAQKELGSKERRKNLEKAFGIHKKIKNYQSVVLVDDIYTTGSTVNALAKLLKEQGVKQVYVVVVCIGRGNF